MQIPHTKYWRNKHFTIMWSPSSNSCNETTRRTFWSMINMAGGKTSMDEEFKLEENSQKKWLTIYNLSNVFQKPILFTSWLIQPVQSKYELNTFIYFDQIYFYLKWCFFAFFPPLDCYIWMIVNFFFPTSNQCPPTNIERLYESVFRKLKLVEDINFTCRNRILRRTYAKAHVPPDFIKVMFIFAGMWAQIMS